MPLRVRESILGDMRKHLEGYVKIGKRNIFLHLVQTGSWAHTFFFAKDTEGSFPDGGVTWREGDRSLIPTSDEVTNGETVLHSSLSLHGVMFDWLSTGTILPLLNADWTASVV
jgi:hypothetical protein